MMNSTAIPLSLYIHIPWCIRKCPYCDFNSHQAPDSLDEAQYIEALLADLRNELPAIWGRKLHSIFIGGGTPSLFSPESMQTLLSGIRSVIRFRPNIEVTLEANPGTFEQERFTGFREAGINRLSIGVQSFDASQLKALGRVHNHTEALRAGDIARQAGFDNFNLDLMFALPGQQITQALDDLQQAIALNPTHLSWYQLTLEPNTEFHKFPPQLPDEDLCAEIQQAGQALLNESCYNQYEVSAYAKTGYTCQHNRNYWEFGDYIGIGAGAHGKITQYHPERAPTLIRYQKYRQPAQYIRQALQGAPCSTTHELPEDNLGFEFMLNALRLKQGFNLNLFSERCFRPLSDLDAELKQAVSRGLIEIDNTSIRPTPLGWQFLNEAIQLFLRE